MPRTEFGEAAGFLDEIGAGAENQMIGICQNGLRAKFVHLFYGESFNHGTRCGADESWRFNVAMWRMDSTDASETAFLMNIELQHVFSLYQLYLIDTRVILGYNRGAGWSLGLRLEESPHFDWVYDSPRVGT